MNKYIITCCSTVDLTKEHLETRNVPFVCFRFNMDGVDYLDDLGQTMSLSDFYKKISTGSISKTTQVNIQEFIDFFETFLQEGKDIIHISLSSALSGTFNSANIAKTELLEKYPGRRIEIIDSLGASSGSGLLVDSLLDMRDKGASFDAVHKWAETNKLKVHHWFFSTDLSSYIRGGRISRTAGFIGAVLGICPLLNMSNTGHLVPREKVRLKKRVIKAIVEKMNQHAEGGYSYNGTCFISHSACLEDAKAVAALVEANFPHLVGKVVINDIGTVIGSHTGQGTVALFFMGDKRNN